MGESYGIRYRNYRMYWAFSQPVYYTTLHALLGSASVQILKNQMALVILK